VQKHKAQLRRQLADHGWEVVAAEDGEEWWADELWTAQSRRNLWGHELVLTFLVDPQWEGPRKKGQGVWAVAASRGRPAGCSAEGRIALLRLAGRRFDEASRSFVAALDAHRNELEQEQAARRG
jgi:hypothetical protein